MAQGYACSGLAEGFKIALLVLTLSLVRSNGSSCPAVAGSWHLAILLLRGKSGLYLRLLSSWLVLPSIAKVDKASMILAGAFQDCGLVR